MQNKIVGYFSQFSISRYFQILAN